MAVQPKRPTWTDERLDDLSQSIRYGFARNDAEHLAMREEIREGFNNVDQRIDALQRTLIISMAGLIASIVAAAATVATILG